MKRVMILICLVFLVNISLISAEVYTDSYKLEKSSTRFRFGYSILDVVSSAVSDNNLPNFLRDGEIIFTPYESYEYTQKLALANLTYSNFTDSDYIEDVYALGIRVGTGKPILNYTLTFTSYPVMESLVSKKLFFLGKNYTVIISNLSEKKIVLNDSDGNYITLTNNSLMKYNLDYVTSLTSYLNTYEGNKLSEIKLVWKADVDMFAAEQANLTFPISNALKLRYLGLGNDSYHGIYGNFTLEALSYSDEVITCVESWNCSSWSSCVDGHKNKTCNDINNCGTTANKPDLSASCSDTLVNCTAECSTNGVKMCFDSTNYKTCGNYDSDNCLEWSSQTACPTNTICSGNGECAANPSNTNECNSIGSVSNGKYCASNYTLIPVKAEGISCQSNYECSSNKCENNKCILVKESSGSWAIFWIIGGIIIIIVIVVVVLIVVLKSNKSSNNQVTPYYSA